ncbi:stage V sporulation protein D [Clostridium cochlearium]|uniref:Stage V sporulation protein D n=1 Tax=Clostridium cochlearium TaxID=1494 RepID=A0A240AAX0_CLOCO|nr:stage V sporulation protein D [Clostridium cochlearium]MDU1442838.1 stage V sporulation protein D [Clostridium cochlearium]SDL06878.1 stage V sporulation protein D (sporulation-specific penicillin-binding protein) [Clostridium cochlearium]SNV80380.1 stage V sporulation protein D [Clostridium cochlearium]SQB34892.1 stage V sporulation protein D [Clostridium cochlearium]STA92841.1 stage V sporulation protein D [Clostridium cochlearium]
MSKKNYRDKVLSKKRMFLVLMILAVLFTGLMGRLIFVMVYKSPDYKKAAIDQWTSEVEISAKRGRILDRNGNELAISANVYRIDLDLNALRSTMKTKKLTTEDVASKLAEALEMEKEDVVKVIEKKLPNGLPYGSATLKRRIEKSMADKVKELDLWGVIVSADTKRYYPNENYLAHVLGHTNSDGDGLAGIEMQYNSVLSGKPGKRIAELDNTRSRQLPYVISEFTKPEDGKDVVLTIDEMIQHFCEKAATQALSDNKAKAVSIMAMNPNNGEILALVNKPDYNPNNPWVEGKTSEELQKMWRNRAISDTFEPGSIFKVITSTAALEENLVSEEDRFYCKGSTVIGKRTVRCWKSGGHGSQTFVEILKNSCNVGFTELGKKIGKENLYKYIRKFGFGEKTGVDVPGEALGIIKNPANISELDLATISFGQTNTVSIVQYLSAFNAVANGGKLIKPHFLKEIQSYDEETGVKKTEKKFEDYNEKKILSEEKTAQLRGYLEKVISEGGGKKAFIEGYTIGGKTGTAQKVIDGKYGPQKYISSFAGMAPAEKPQITLFVSIDEPDPSNYYAGQIAAPVAQQVFNDIFNYLSIKGNASDSEIAESLKKDIVIPEIRGLKKAEALKILKEQKLDYNIDEKGDYITDMNPKPGYTVKEGSKIVLYTGKTSNYNRVVAVPDIRGYTIENASKLLNSLGLKITYSGSGLIYEQSVKEDEEVPKGTTIHVKLEEVID